MAFLTGIKLNVLRDTLKDVSEAKIVDLLADFGQRQFGKSKNEYLEAIRQKLALVVQEIGRRMEEK